MSGTNTLVTGASGFLGMHVLRVLEQRAQAATVLVRSRPSWRDQTATERLGSPSVIEGDLLQSTRWLEQARDFGVRTIVHTAGIVQHSRVNPEPMIEANVRGTLEMVRAAHALGARLVFLSSSGTVGCFRFHDLTADEDALYAEELVARWPYYVSKIRAEREARRLAERLGVELVIVRPPVLLGPDDHRGRSTSYVGKILRHSVPAIPPGGMHFTDVRDVASALVRLTTLRNPRAIYHLPGTASTLADFFRMVTDVSDARMTERSLPRWAAKSLARVGASLPRRPHWLPDPVVLEMSTRFWGLTSLYADELGYAPRAARQTLVDTVNWLQRDPVRRVA